MSPEKNYLFNMNLLKEALEAAEDDERRECLKKAIKQIEEMEVRRLKSDEEFLAQWGFPRTYVKDEWDSDEEWETEDEA